MDQQRRDVFYDDGYSPVVQLCPNMTFCLEVDARFYGERIGMSGVRQYRTTQLVVGAA